SRCVFEPPAAGELVRDFAGSRFVPQPPGVEERRSETEDGFPRRGRHVVQEKPGQRDGGEPPPVTVHRPEFHPPESVRECAAQDGDTPRFGGWLVEPPNAIREPIPDRERED